MRHLILIAVVTLSRTSIIEANTTRIKPSGACTVKVYGISDTCTNSVTEDACNKIAKKVGGIADWVESETCPPK